MTAAHDAAIHRAKAYCLLVSARYRLSGESLQMALVACEHAPAKATACYIAILRSLPKECVSAPHRPIALKTTDSNRRTNMDIEKKSPRIAAEKSPFMGLAQVLELIPISRSMVYLMIADGEFPKPKKLGLRAAAWSREEVNAWIADKLK